MKIKVLGLDGKIEIPVVSADIHELGGAVEKSEGSQIPEIIFHEKTRNLGHDIELRQIRIDHLNHEDSTTSSQGSSANHVEMGKPQLELIEINQNLRSNLKQNLDNNILDENNEFPVCYICHEDIKNTKDENLHHARRCGHISHMACVQNWNQINNSCGICRTEFENDEFLNQIVPKPHLEDIICKSILAVSILVCVIIFIMEAAQK